MKKLHLILVFLLVCLVSFGFRSQQRQMGIIGQEQAAGATDYTQDANCMGAWYMNGGESANGDNETDRSGEGGTLIESSGDIPDSATVPSGYSGTSRDFERGDTEALYHADGNSTDISGADQKLSFCAWIKFEADPADDIWIVDKYETAGNQKGYKFQHDHGLNAMKVNLSSDGSAFVSAVGATDLADDTDWHHVCFVYNDVDIRIYVDGSLDSNGADNPKAYTAGIFNNTDDFSIGAESRSGGGFDGLIDEVIIFDRDLSAAEISDIYTNGISGDKGGSD
jgi:hypothetical protein